MYAKKYDYLCLQWKVVFYKRKVRVQLGPPRLSRLDVMDVIFQGTNIL